MWLARDRLKERCDPPSSTNDLRLEVGADLFSLHGSEFALVGKDVPGGLEPTAREIKFRRESIKQQILSSEGKICIHTGAEIL